MWWSEKSAEQKKKSPNEPPAYTVSNIAEKIQVLDREVKYLLNKAKFAKPKPKVKPTDTANDTTKAEGEKPEKPEEKTTNDKPGKQEQPEIGEETPEETNAKAAAADEGETTEETEVEDHSNPDHSEL